MSTKEIGIIVGEDADLPEDFLKKHTAISVYPFIVQWEALSEEKNAFYSTMRMYLASREKGAPKTSQPTVGTFKRLFEKGLSAYNELYVVCVSSKLSGCLNSALQAKIQLNEHHQKRIHIIESLTSSGGTALLVFELIKLLSAGTRGTELEEKLSIFQKTIHVIGMIEDPFWLQSGGRISFAVALLINQMRKMGIRPLLGSKDGKIALLNVRINAVDKVNALLTYLVSQVKGKHVEIIITHADAHSAALQLEKLIVEKVPTGKVLYVNQLAPVLGAHLGPDSLLLAWREVNS